MSNSIYNITLDVRKTQSQAVISVSAGDTMRTIRASFTDGIMPYPIAEGCTTVFSALKPDGVRIFEFCTIENNTTVYHFSEQTANVPGLVACQIIIYGENGGIIAAPKFQIAVSDRVIGDYPVSEDQSNIIDCIVSAENSRVNAENGRETAENDRRYAEKERIIAEDGRVKAEKTREENEAIRIENDKKRPVLDDNVTDLQTVHSSKKNAEDFQQKNILLEVQNGIDGRYTVPYTGDQIANFVRQGITVTLGYDNTLYAFERLDTSRVAYFGVISAATKDKWTKKTAAVGFDATVTFGTKDISSDKDVTAVTNSVADGTLSTIIYLRDGTKVMSPATALPQGGAIRVINNADGTVDLEVYNTVKVIENEDGTVDLSV